MDMEERRKADEAFRLKIVEQQGEIKALQQQTNVEIRGLADRINEHTHKISDIELALWGYPKSDEEGLLNKNRNQNRKWAIVLFIVNVVAWSAIGLIKPLYTKWVTDWAYNSVSEKWSREQQRPKVRHYHIIEKRVDTPPPSPASTAP